MPPSADRFLTTHTGSLPRPDALIRLMFAKENGTPVDAAALDETVRRHIADMAVRQSQAGVDIINDGEMSKPSYATYVKDRLSGFGGSGNTYVFQDLADYPKSAARVFGDPGRKARKAPACNGPIALADTRSPTLDMENLAAAAGGAMMFS